LNERANGKAKLNGGNGRDTTNDKRTEVEAKFVRDLIAEGLTPIAAVRRLAAIVDPGPWQRKPGPRANGRSV
jgi:hypothetical protein